MVITLKNKSFKITDKTTLKDLFKDKYLYGRLETCTITLTNAVDVAAYIPGTNTIAINRDLVNSESTTEILKFALLHEFQHALQYENTLNLGMDVSLFSRCSKVVQNAIIADVKEHLPHLFKDNPSDEIIKERVANYIYHSTAESMAMGLDASALIDFYPTIVRDIEGGMQITLAWGSTFNLLPIIKMYGLSIESTSISNPLNYVLNNATEAISLEDFIKNPSNAFITPSGEIRPCGTIEHYELIKQIDPGVDTNYWNSLPQINAAENFWALNISGNITDGALNTLLQLMDINLLI